MNRALSLTPTFRWVYAAAHEISNRLSGFRDVPRFRKTTETPRAQRLIGRIVLCALRVSAVFLPAFILLESASLASQPQLSVADLSRIRFEQHLHDEISLDLPFTDESGQAVRLQNFFDGKPVVLMLGYFGCPMLCGLVLNGAIEAFQDLKATPGKDFEFIFVSIDPKETPLLASEKKARYLKRYGRPEAAAGWHFLTASERSVEKLSSQVGFHYAYDPATKQYAHPSGFVVLTANGQISRYFFGVTYSATELSAALKAASANRVSSPIQELLLLCFHYSPITGKYGPLIMVLVRIGAALTLLAIVAAILVYLRRERSKRLCPIKGGAG